jgi:hypothetical protein
MPIQNLTWHFWKGYRTHKDKGAVVVRQSPLLIASHGFEEVLKNVRRGKIAPSLLFE